MKIEIEDGVFKLSGLYSGVILEADNGVGLAVCQRDGVFEVRERAGEGWSWGEWHKMVPKGERDEGERAERFKNALLAVLVATGGLHDPNMAMINYHVRKVLQDDEDGNSSSQPVMAR